eukprot:4530877-Amphidinium_carterae.1
MAKWIPKRTHSATLQLAYPIADVSHARSHHEVPVFGGEKKFVYCNFIAMSAKWPSRSNFGDTFWCILKNPGTV